jgi:ribonuclease-3
MHRDDDFSDNEKDRLACCEERIKYRFRNRRLLFQALTHSSIKTLDNPSNERLEFLGDSVLGLVMTEFLFNFFQERDEGALTQIKSVVVSTAILAKASTRLSVDELYSVGKGVSRKRTLPDSLRANVFEAIVAAIYKDGGLEAARRFILRNVYHEVLAVADDRQHLNYKSLLQQYAQKELCATPTYRVVSESGPDHYKSFEVVAQVGKVRYCAGAGRSKKEAEQLAAQATLEKLLEERDAAVDGATNGLSCTES